MGYEFDRDDEDHDDDDDDDDGPLNTLQIEKCHVDIAYSHVIVSAAHEHINVI